jgi:hypothetical protein
MAKRTRRQTTYYSEKFEYYDVTIEELIREKHEFKEFVENMRKFIVATKFTYITLQENYNYRKSKNINCIYNSPIEISSKIPPDSIIFVLEMNNDINEIAGIGMVRNHPIVNKHKIHENQNYNRYSFIGKYHISKEEMTQEEIDVLEALEHFCFRTKAHIKRCNGMRQFPTEILFRLSKVKDIIEFIGNMFKKRIEKHLQQVK